MTLTQTLKQHWKWFTAGGLALLVVAGLAIAAFLGAFSTSEDVAAPPPTAAVTTPTPTPTPTPTHTAEPPAEVNISTVQTMPYTEVWNPPDVGENFWQVVDPENGYPETGGTDYILAHACELEGCAGDLIRTLTPGDDFTYKGAEYVVDEKLEIHKSEIGNQPIWEHVPGRVVVITCILDKATMTFEENDIIIASPAA